MTIKTYVETQKMADSRRELLSYPIKGLTVNDEGEKTVIFSFRDEITKEERIEKTGSLAFYIDYLATDDMAPHIEVQSEEDGTIKMIGDLKQSLFCLMRNGHISVHTQNCILKDFNLLGKPHNCNIL